MLDNISQAKVFDGWHKQYRHQSQTLHCEMRFAIYLPPDASVDNPVPVLYWLSGLTCTDENFMQKAGAFKKAAELGIAIVAPDTSPRGEGVQDDPNGEYDLGSGAGFYLNATQAPWSEHYRMYDYIVDELPKLIESFFPVQPIRAISGHSMGGHGALTIGIKNPDRYTSISAFAPICNPTCCAWGQKAFRAYLGTDEDKWQEYDAVELLKRYSYTKAILIDQGEEDNFLVEQLKPEALASAASIAGVDLKLRYHSGYDHSYFFIQSYIEQHLAFHAQFLFPN